MGYSPTSSTLPSMLLATTLYLLFVLPSYSEIQIKEGPRGSPLLARSTRGGASGEMLSILESSLLFVASPIELKEEDRRNVAHAISICAHRSKIEDELARIYDDIHVLLDSHLVPSAAAAKSKIEADLAWTCESHLVPFAGAAQSKIEAESALICDSDWEKAAFFFGVGERGSLRIACRHRCSWLPLEAMIFSTNLLRSCYDWAPPATMGPFGDGCISCSGYACPGDVLHAAVTTRVRTHEGAHVWPSLSSA